MAKKNIKREILTKISKEEIKMKPQWIFKLKKEGVRGIWLLAILAGSVAISVIYYFMELYNPEELLADYGSIGRDLFFTDFPYLWLLGVIVFLGGGAILLTKIGDNYRKPIKKLILITTIIIAGMTIAVITVRGLLKF
jgi:hypothetical protein